jgi:hypothetical protein
MRKIDKRPQGIYFDSSITRAATLSLVFHEKKNGGIVPPVEIKP